MKTVVATSPPRAAPATVWAGVWSPSRTRDQATSATVGTVRVSAGPKVRGRMATRAPGAAREPHPRPGHQCDRGDRQGERGAEGESEDGDRAAGGGGVDRQLPPQGH